MGKLFSTAIMFGMACLFAGCAQTYNLRVDALTDPQVAGEAGRFLLESGFPDTPGSSLRFREAADYAGRALRARGYERAEDESEADLIVTVSATISEPLNESERRLEPIYYQSWARSEVIVTPIVDKEGNKSYVRTRVYVPPQTRFAGYDSYDRSVVVYEKQLELTARTPAGDEAWTVEVTTIDRSSDLRSYLPYLAAAATPYLGETTDGSVVVRVKEGHEMVEYLQGMTPRPPEAL